MNDDKALTIHAAITRASIYIFQLVIAPNIAYFEMYICQLRYKFPLFAAKLVDTQYYMWSKKSRTMRKAQVSQPATI
jgi:hypothetical protein